MVVVTIFLVLWSRSLPLVLAVPDDTRRVVCAGSNQYRRALPPLFSGTAGVLPYKLALAWVMGLDWLLARSRIVGRAGDDDVASEQRNKDRPW